jgi:hypothetical protein
MIFYLSKSSILNHQSSILAIGNYSSWLLKFPKPKLDYHGQNHFNSGT